MKGNVVMVHLRAKQLLLNAAREQFAQRKGISSKEITERLNEIKYLSSQRKVPKLTLRREILSLERKLANLFEVEKRLLHAKKKESAKIRSLKRQNTLLKERLEKSSDPELRARVGKLSHVLGDILAKAQTKEDVALAHKILGDLEGEDRRKVEKQELSLRSKKLLRLEDILSRVKHKLHLLELEHKVSPMQLRKLQELLAKLEHKLEELKKDKGKASRSSSSGKHKILFDAVDVARPDKKDPFDVSAKNMPLALPSPEDVQKELAEQKGLGVREQSSFGNFGKAPVPLPPGPSTPLPPLPKPLPSFGAAKSVSPVSFDQSLALPKASSAERIIEPNAGAGIENHSDLKNQLLAGVGELENKHQEVHGTALPPAPVPQRTQKKGFHLFGK